MKAALLEKQWEIPKDATDEQLTEYAKRVAAEFTYGSNMRVSAEYRKHLAEDGLIIAVCTIEAGSGRVVSGPDIVSRGFVYVRESEALMDEARRLVNSTIEQCADENVREWSAIKLRVRDNLSRLLYNRTKRSPMILPIIMEV